MSEVLFRKSLPTGIFETHNQKPETQVYKCNQFHSSQVTDVRELKEDVQSDGIHFDLKTSKVISIITADCLPIIILGKQEAVFLHAGWKGLALGILASNYTKEIEPQYIFIGPHISFNHYEVSPEFQDEFPNSNQAFKTQDGKTFFGLEIEARRQIANLYGPITVESSNICTYETKEFHSYRRDKTNHRNWNIFKIN